jgi:hypothetical protein
LGDKRIAVQCKNYAKPVGNKPVQEVYAGATYYGATQAWVVAPQGFTKGGFELASRLGVLLFDGSAIRGWMHQINVAPQSEQGTKDREYYDRLLQLYQEVLDKMQPLYESKAKSRGNPADERLLEESRSQMYNLIDFLLGKLYLLEARNTNLPTEQRTELQARQAEIESSVVVSESRWASEAQASSDRANYLKLLDVYRGFLGVLEKLHAAESEHEDMIAINPRVRESYIEARNEIHKEIDGVLRDLDILESRSTDLPTEDRAELQALGAPLMDASPPVEDSENPTQKAEAVPPPPEVPPQNLPPAPKVAPDTNIYEHIRRLAELRDEGHITPEEFEAKKRELLDRL